jgi:hypothetical protein
MSTFQDIYKLLLAAPRIQFLFTAGADQDVLFIRTSRKSRLRCCGGGKSGLESDGIIVHLRRLETILFGLE